MFTVKFYRAFGDTEMWNHISCPHYTAEKREDGTTIITCFKDMTGLAGTEIHVGPDDWHACFVENSTGKTVDKHRARVE